MLTLGTYIEVVWDATIAAPSDGHRRFRML